MAYKALVKVRDDLKTLIDGIDVLHEQAQTVKKSSDEIARRLDYKFQQGKLVSWDTLFEMRPGEWLMLGEGVYSHRLPSSVPHHIIFNVVFGEGGRLLTHMHDCAENLWIVRGRLIDTQDNNREITKHIFYPPNTIHELFAPEPCRCSVEFLHPDWDVLRDKRQ